MNETSFVCYFCNELIKNDSINSHSSICAHILQPCPNKCGAYIRRLDRQAHQAECANSTLVRSKKPTTSKQTSSPMEKTIENLHQRLTLLEKQTSNRVNSPVDANTLDAWKKNVNLKLETLKDAVLGYQRGKNDHDVQLAQIQPKMQLFDNLQLDLNRHFDTFVKEHNYIEERFDILMQNFDAVRMGFDDTCANLEHMWAGQKQILDQLAQENEQVRTELNETKAKLSALSFDVKTITHIASTSKEKLDIQEREFNQSRKEVEQLRLDFEILESLSAGETGFGAPITSPGHLIWRVGDFASKMSKSKELNSVLKSQAFYSHDFGYKMRVLLYLDGLRKWKGRYALISLHVIKGEFDELLQWPCNIDGTVILRDLRNLNNPKNVSKVISAKRAHGDDEGEEPQESSSTYIFIPHATLTKTDYLQDDCVFFEVRVNEQKAKLTTETTL